jgi:hypothetical protein
MRATVTRDHIMTTSFAHTLTPIIGGSTGMCLERSSASPAFGTAALYMCNGTP